MTMTSLKLITAICGVLAISACSSPSTGNVDKASAPTFEITKQTPQPSGELDQLRWATYAEPFSIDYAYTFDIADNQVLANVCESLLRLNPDMSVAPSLATEFSNPTPTTWVYTIRDGVKFHDGTVMTADDVVASMQRHLDPEVGSYWYSIYQNVERIEKSAPNQVTVTSRIPDATFNEAMSGAAGVIESAATLEALGADYGNSTGGVNCTGPFAFDSWKSGERIKFTRFDEYWNPDLMAKAEELEFIIMPDAAARVNAMKAGEVDGSWMIPSDAIDDLRASDSGDVFFGLNTAVNSLVVTNADGPLGNPEVRKALLMAIDREGLLQAAEAGYGTRTNALTTESVWEQADPETREAAFGQLIDYPYDPEAAKKIIEAEGVAGQEIVITTAPIGNNFTVIAQGTAAAAKSIGLKATLNTVTANNYGSLFSDPDARSGTDLMFTSWYLSIGDPLEMFSVLRTGDFSNYGSWTNPEYDKSVNEALSTMDIQDRFRLSLTAQQILNEEIPWLPLYENPNLLWMSDHVTGASPSVNFLYYPWAAEIGAK